jgi:hypothetical protein
MDIGFADFQRMAQDPQLSACEKIGFPDSYRKGKERAILRDLLAKLTNLAAPRQVVLDVGPGCSGLARMLMAHCSRRRHELFLFDSLEMLALLPEGRSLRKVPGRFPDDCRSHLPPLTGRANVILVYSVFQYVFAEGRPYDFLDTCLALLAPGGQLLLGDIPNVSKRKRFFASATGRKFHRAFTRSRTEPQVQFNTPEPGHLDDAVVASILGRCRAAGYDAYVLPQASDLPMANRREDILIIRP